MQTNQKGTRALLVLQDFLKPIPVSSLLVKLGFTGTSRRKTTYDPSYLVLFSLPREMDSIAWLLITQKPLVERILLRFPNH